MPNSPGCQNDSRGYNFEQSRDIFPWSDTKLIILQNLKKQY